MARLYPAWAWAWPWRCVGAGAGAGVDNPVMLGEITRSAVFEPDGGDGYARRVQVMDTDAA